MGTLFILDLFIETPPADRVLAGAQKGAGPKEKEEQDRKDSSHGPSSLRASGRADLSKRSRTPKLKGHWYRFQGTRRFSFS